ncbi:MAG: helix-turn-helix domain-containing protein [Muribaculaceae bacterium]|nr:helix-turn-helix domain-containing protein [Muribaculaceae bacterium]
MTGLRQKFGARIKELRKRKNWTQEYLAEIINIDTRSLRKIELGESFPSIVTLEKLLEILDVPTSELFNFEHLKSEADLRSELIDIINNNPDKIEDIYKVVKAMVS